MKVRGVFILALFITAWGAMFGPNFLDRATAQQTYNFPTVYTVSSTVVGWTAGTVNNGGHAVTVTAGTASVTTSKADCTSPAYAGCNIVYAGSTGTVSVTLVPATATADGNSILAYVETSGSAVSSIVYPMQASIPGMPQRIVAVCGTTSTCANTPYGPSVRRFGGSVALASATPSTVTVGPFSPAFSSVTSYFCTAVPVGNTAAIAAAGVAVTINATTNVTFTGPNSVTTVIHYWCEGT